MGGEGREDRRREEGRGVVRGMGGEEGRGEGGGEGSGGAEGRGAGEGRVERKASASGSGWRVHEHLVCARQNNRPRVRMRRRRRRAAGAGAGRAPSTRAVARCSRSACGFSGSTRRLRSANIAILVYETLRDSHRRMGGVLCTCGGGGWRGLFCAASASASASCC